MKKESIKKYQKVIGCGFALIGFIALSGYCSKARAEDSEIVSIAQNPSDSDFESALENAIVVNSQEEVVNVQEAKKPKTSLLKPPHAYDNARDPQPRAPFCVFDANRHLICN